MAPTIKKTPLAAYFAETIRADVAAGGRVGEISSVSNVERKTMKRLLENHEAGPDTLWRLVCYYYGERKTTGENRKHLHEIRAHYYWQIKAAYPKWEASPVEGEDLNKPPQFVPPTVMSAEQAERLFGVIRKDEKLPQKYEVKSVPAIFIWPKQLAEKVIATGAAFWSAIFTSLNTAIAYFIAIIAVAIILMLAFKNYDGCKMQQSAIPKNEDPVNSVKYFDSSGYELAKTQGTTPSAESGKRKTSQLSVKTKEEQKQAMQEVISSESAGVSLCGPVTVGAVMDGSKWETTLSFIVPSDNTYRSNIFHPTGHFSDNVVTGLLKQIESHHSLSDSIKQWAYGKGNVISTDAKTELSTCGLPSLGIYENISAKSPGMRPVIWMFSSSVVGPDWYAIATPSEPPMIEQLALPPPSFNCGNRGISVAFRIHGNDSIFCYTLDIVSARPSTKLGDRYQNVTGVLRRQLKSPTAADNVAMYADYLQDDIEIEGIWYDRLLIFSSIDDDFYFWLYQPLFANEWAYGLYCHGKDIFQEVGIDPVTGGGTSICGVREGNNENLSDGVVQAIMHGPSLRRKVGWPIWSYGIERICE